MHVYSDPASERHVNSMAGVEAPERFPAALAGVEEAKRAGVPVEHRPCQPAPTEALEAAHAPRYLESLEELSARGGGYVDFDTALSQDSWEAATLAAGAAVGAVESTLEGTAAFAIARPPGHHAGRDYGMGFCLVNNAAVAREVGVAPPAFLLEGGYNLNALTACVAATIKGTEENSSPAWEYSGGAGPVEAARKALSPFWECLR